MRGEKTLWLETHSKNLKYFSQNRIDGVMVALLPELLRRGEDIKSEIPISRRLYYQLTHILNPILIEKSQGLFKMIEIDCPLTEEISCLQNRVSATGMSFGIDSLYSYYTHRSEKQCDREHIVKLITFFNHGSLNGQYQNNESEMRKVFNRGEEKVIEFANAEGIDFLAIDSNLDSLYKRNYTETHTFRTAGLVLMFSKLIKNYYYSSGCKIEDFNINVRDDSAYYDILSLPLLSTEEVCFYSDGLNVGRFSKTEYLAKNMIGQDILSVCWSDIDNCGECPKCIIVGIGEK